MSSKVRPTLLAPLFTLLSALSNCVYATNPFASFFKYLTNSASNICTKPCGLPSVVFPGFAPVSDWY